MWCVVQSIPVFVSINKYSFMLQYIIINPKWLRLLINFNWGAIGWCALLKGTITISRFDPVDFGFQGFTHWDTTALLVCPNILLYQLLKMSAQSSAVIHLWLEFMSFTLSTKGWSMKSGPPMLRLRTSIFFRMA